MFQQLPKLDLTNEDHLTVHKLFAFNHFTTIKNGLAVLLAVNIVSADNEKEIEISRNCLREMTLSHTDVMPYEINIQAYNTIEFGFTRFKWAALLWEKARNMLVDEEIAKYVILSLNGVPPEKMDQLVEYKLDGV